MPPAVEKHYHRCPHAKCRVLYCCDLRGCSGWAYKVCAGCYATVHHPEAKSVKDTVYQEPA